MAVTRLAIEYDGTRFSGWAAQEGARTVQSELEGALGMILREPIRLSVAGRTDTGVHARGQVASFPLKGVIWPDLAHRVNGVTGRDVSITAVEEVAEGFDARRDARSRTYCYRILTRRVASPFEQLRALWWPHPLDRALLKACAAMLHGSHDFTAFTPTQTEHVRFERRVLRADWVAGAGETLELWIEADSFMRSMVRVLVGTMLDVATGRRTIENFAGLLAGAPRERAGETAAAHGLYLDSVTY